MLALVSLFIDTYKFLRVAAQLHWPAGHIMIWEGLGDLGRSGVELGSKTIPHEMSRSQVHLVIHVKVLPAEKHREQMDFQ